MKWLEISIKTRSSDIDALCERLEEMGVGGMVIEDENDFRAFLENNREYWDYVDEELEAQFRGLSRVKFYAADDDEGRALLAQIRREGYDAADALIDDENWENNWREHYVPIEIGEKLVIVPEWEDAPEGGRIPVRLDPGLIFGTGSHATTRMCLEFLDALPLAGARVLDLGCGSGILGIAALCLGAASVTGCDIDPKSPDVACANAALNGFAGEIFRILAGDVIKDTALRRELGDGYDIVLCNIVSDVIIPLAEYIPAFLKPGGVVITSGIIEGREDEVAAALQKAGLSIIESRASEDWHAFKCGHSS